VNISDFSLLASNFNQSSNFGGGDFNYSGTVEIQDFALLAAKFNFSLARPAPGASVGPASANPAAPRTLASAGVQSPFAASQPIRDDILNGRSAGDPV
jgi:hypothetical protein